MTSWPDYVHYSCENCGELCINHADTDRAQLNICRGCYRDRLVEEYEQQLKQDSTSATSEGGRESPPSHGGPTDRVSARGRPEGRPPSQRESPAEGPERGCGVPSTLDADESVAPTDE